MSAHLLSIVTFLPLFAAIPVLVLPLKENGIRWATLLASLVTLAASLALWGRVDPISLTGGKMIQEGPHPWIPFLGITYTLGVDGISVLLVLLTTLLTPIVVLSSWSSISTRVREFHVFLLVMETAMVGAFLALDAVLFYFFWEAMLVPMYFLIGIWGGQRRIYAAVKFFLFTAVGSLLMLVAILYLMIAHHEAFPEAASHSLWSELLKLELPRSAQLWLFAAFGLAFAIKVPMFPFHTWLPDAHTEAPTGGSVLLAGVLLKMGAYGFIRWAIPLFPAAAVTFAPLILGLATVGVVYGALVSLVQPDMKRMIAYSSVSHLGFVMLGLFAVGEGTGLFSREAVSGAVLQMVNHGLSTGALFLLVGVIYERRHTREIAAFGGLALPMPIYAAAFLFTILSSIGLPGLNGFVGEFLILLGTFRSSWIPATVSTLGVVLGAVYLLWLYQRVALGPVTRPENKRLPDASLREALYLAPLLAGMVWIGLHPAPFLGRIAPSVDATLSQVEARAGAEPSLSLAPTGADR